MSDKLQATTSARARAIVDAYYYQLCADIQQYGLCREKLGQAEGFADTRLLCQTRSMFFLIRYHTLAPHSAALNQALTLYEHFHVHYYSPEQQQWYQYPGQHHALDDLYEYAFLIFSIAALAQATGHYERYRGELESLHGIIQQHYFAPEQDFRNLADNSGVVSQNALMHLFEAYLALYQAIPDAAYHQVLKQLLASTHRLFYDPETCLISEYTPFAPEDAVYEPGHTFEWCCLLLEAEQTGIDISVLDNIRMLAEAAESVGVTGNNIVKPQISAHEDAVRFRIWPMLERLRYSIMAADFSRTEQVFATVDQYFIDNNDLPVEYINPQLQHDFNGVKTTTAYHLINCMQHLALVT